MMTLNLGLPQNLATIFLLLIVPLFTLLSFNQIIKFKDQEVAVNPSGMMLFTILALGSLLAGLKIFQIEDQRWQIAYYVFSLTAVIAGYFHTSNGKIGWISLLLFLILTCLIYAPFVLLITR